MKLCRATLVLILLIATGVPAHGAWDPSGNRVHVGFGHSNQPPEVIPFGRGILLCYVGFLAPGQGGLILRAIDSTGVTASGWPAQGLLVQPSGEAQLAPAPDGGAYVVWRTGFDQIRMLRVTKNGDIAPGWQAGGYVVAVGDFGSARLFDIVPDDSGGLYIALHTGSTNGEYRLIRVSDSGGIPPGWPVEGVRIGGWFDVIAPVAVAADGAGGILHASRINAEPDTTVIRRYRPDGTLDPAWPPGGARLTFPPRDVYVRAMFADPNGVLVVGIDFGLCGSICPTWPARAIRLDASGNIAAGWPAAGKSLGGSWMEISDGQGGLLKAATLGCCGGYTNRVLRFDADAQLIPGWQSPGNPLCDPEQMQGMAPIVPDGEGGLFASWIDQRSGTEVLYGTHLTPSGAIAPGWPAAGLVAAPGSAPSTWAPQLVMSGWGDPIMLWADVRDDTSDTYMKPLVVPTPPVSVDPDGRSDFAITDVHPNPASGPFTVTMAIPDPAPATLELVDLSGRVIESRSLPGAARSSVRFDVFERLPAGVYWMRLRQEARTTTARVVFIR